ncbi:MAG: hypothetical protein LBD58_08445, partial [Treponema sp.]|nr:hypothetical protein [Treponema sp.]
LKFLLSKRLYFARSHATMKSTNVLRLEHNSTSEWVLQCAEDRFNHFGQNFIQNWQVTDIAE